MANFALTVFGTLFVVLLIYVAGRYLDVYLQDKYGITYNLFKQSMVPQKCIHDRPQGMCNKKNTMF